MLPGVYLSLRMSPSSLISSPRKRASKSALARGDGGRGGGCLSCRLPTLARSELTVWQSESNRGWRMTATGGSSAEERSGNDSAEGSRAEEPVALLVLERFTGSSAIASQSSSAASPSASSSSHCPAATGPALPLFFTALGGRLAVGAAGVAASTSSASSSQDSTSLFGATGAAGVAASAGDGFDTLGRPLTGSAASRSVCVR